MWHGSIGFGGAEAMVQIEFLPDRTFRQEVQIRTGPGDFSGRILGFWKSDSENHLEMMADDIRFGDQNTFLQKLVTERLAAETGKPLTFTVKWKSHNEVSLAGNAGPSFILRRVK